MSGKNVRATLVGAVLLALGTVGAHLAANGQPATPAPTAPPPAPSVAGELAFSETIVFDYDRDRKQDRVQFWIAFEARPAPGEPSPKVESGSLKYFVYDLARKQRIDNWMLGFNMTMGGDFPRAGEAYPITNVRISGRTATFEFSGATWTITDGGPTWTADTIDIRDYRGTRRAQFYGGDVRVVSESAAVSEPVANAANAPCVECHREAAVAIAATGGPHRELECASCHTEHPPEKEGARPQCASCHQPHGAGMTDAACGQCHLGHAPATSAIAATVPDAYCAACHEAAATTLKASGSLHMGLTCATCHRKEHKATSECQFCHRATHPPHVMQKPGLCASCHNTAHALKSARAQ
jgi:hypothetical protein